MATSPLQPPVPFADFEFAFDPALNSLFPAPPPLPPSADLFSPAETSDLLGFLDNFSDLGWDLAAPDFLVRDPYGSPAYAPYSNPHLSTPSRNMYQSSTTPADEPDTGQTPSDISPTFESPPPPQNRCSSSVCPRSKSLLSSPQKRLNHIMSEQKRRNAIRDGYAQLIALLAPAGSVPGIGMPTRGRPKGSGSSGKGKSKGKSGVLFRAVEYCKWLEEDRDALRAEVVRVESAAGLLHA